MTLQDGLPAGPRRSSATRAVANRATVRHAMDAIRSTGTPKSYPQLVAEIGLTANTIGRYAREYLEEINAELLGWTVQDDAAFQAWTTLYYSFHTQIIASPNARVLQEKLLRLAIESIERSGHAVTFTAVEALTGVAWARVKAAIKAWETDTGRKATRAHVWAPITLPMLLPLVDSALHRMPLTFLDDPKTHRPLTPTSMRMIQGIKQPKLRDTAFLCLAIAETDLKNDSRFFGQLSKYLDELGLTDIDELDSNTFYLAYHDGQAILGASESLRARSLQAYFRLLDKQDAYFRRLSPQQAQCLDRFRLPAVADRFFWRQSPLHAQVREDSRGRRKEATAAIHDKFYLFRNIADRRLNQLVRLRKAFREACGRAQATGAGASFPMSFSYTEEAVTAAGAPRRVIHRFRLWDGRSLRRFHETVAPRRYYETRDTLREFERHLDALFLTYEGGASSGAETSVPAEFWFAELARSGCLTYNPDPGFLATHGYAKGGLYPPVRPEWSQSTGMWLKRVAADLGLVFLPVDTLLGCGLVGHAALQVMTKTGARLGEFLQIRLSREHLTRADLPDGKEVIAFRAKPKGRDAEEPFYIDSRCLKALHAWFGFLREIGDGVEPVEPTYQLRLKCGRAPYLFQFRGRHFDHADINACLRLLLHGVEVATASGRTVQLCAHLFRHGFATEMRSLDVPLDVIALLMKQRDVEVTRYYSRPTPAQLVEVQERIFLDRVDLTRTHIRAPAEVRQQVDAARGGVGALVPVAGGICTVANMCPAKFACLGCAGNAPDPAKRDQVLGLKSIYREMVGLAADQGLRAEERKALDVVAGCEDMLAEMDLIEAADRDREQRPDIDCRPKGPGGMECDDGQGI